MCSVDGCGVSNTKIIKTHVVYEVIEGVQIEFPETYWHSPNFLV